MFTPAFAPQTLPSNIGALTSLRTLTISRQPSLSGTIPSTLAQLTSLYTLDLSFNALGPNLTAAIGAVANFNFILGVKLQGNQFAGRLEQGFSSAFTASTNWLTWDMSANQGIWCV